jgi:hypothetical protein
MGLSQTPAVSQDPGEGALRKLFPKFQRIEEWPRTRGVKCGCAAMRTDMDDWLLVIKNQISS